MEIEAETQIPMDIIPQDPNLPSRTWIPMQFTIHHKHIKQ